jgi:hypothetical protein
MLIDTFDKLTSGKFVSRIVFTNSEVTAPPPGTRQFRPVDSGWRRGFR